MLWSYSQHVLMILSSVWSPLGQLEMLSQSCPAVWKLLKVWMSKNKLKPKPSKTVYVCSLQFSCHIRLLFNGVGLPLGNSSVKAITTTVFNQCHLLSQLQLFLKKEDMGSYSSYIITNFCNVCTLPEDVFEDHLEITVGPK